MPNGQFIHLRKQKIGFLGMIVGLKSIKPIFEDYVNNKEPILKYI